MSVPLRVFEDRYRALVHHLLRVEDPTERVFGSVGIREGYEVGEHGAQWLFRIGCRVKMTEVESHDDGTFELVAVGLDRIELEHLDTSGAYPVGRVTPLAEHARGRAGPRGRRPRGAYEAYREALLEIDREPPDRRPARTTRRTSPGRWPPSPPLSSRSARRSLPRRWAPERSRPGLLKRRDRAVVTASGRTRLLKRRDRATWAAARHRRQHSEQAVVGVVQAPQGVEVHQRTGDPAVGSQEWVRLSEFSWCRPGPEERGAEGRVSRPRDGAWVSTRPRSGSSGSTTEAPGSSGSTTEAPGSSGSTTERPGSTHGPESRSVRGDLEREFDRAAVVPGRDPHRLQRRDVVQGLLVAGRRPW